MTHLLDWINFGTISAERDDLLSEYFYDAGVLRSVLNSRTSFLGLGRKGAGKTAVFRYFAENPSNFVDKNSAIVVSLSLQDYSWSAHEALANPMKASSLAYLQSWKFVIYVQAISALIKQMTSSETKVPKSLKICGRIIEKIYQNPYPNLTQVIGTKLLSLTKLKLPGGNLGLDEGDVEGLSFDTGDLEFSEIQSDNTLSATLSRNI